MNHTRSLTEMLNIPNGNRATNASLTDSQFFFGSQFWPDNSQAASQSVSLSSWNSTSQEESDPTLLRTYTSKPLLFSEPKDKSKFFNLLDKFEEDKKKTKENSDSEILANECVHIRETLDKIYQLATGSEKNSAVCQIVHEKLENFASSLQQNLASLQSDTSLQLQTLLYKVNSQKETMTGLEDKMEKTGCTTTELGCSLLSLKTSVEGLKKDQQSERDMLEEALKLLSTLVSRDEFKQSPVTVMDSIIQTSPSLSHSLSGSLQENLLESTQSNSIGKPVYSQDSRFCTGKRKPTKKFLVKRKRRPLVISQKCKPLVSDENSPSILNCNKLPLPKCSNKNESKAIEPARSFITPLSCWSQDSNSSAYLNGIEPILDKTESAVQPGGLWQLFELDF